MCLVLNIRGRSKLMWYWWYAHLLQFMYFMESLVREHWDRSFHCCLKWIPHRHKINHMFIIIGTWEIIILASASLHCYLQWPSCFICILLTNYRLFLIMRLREAIKNQFQNINMHFLKIASSGHGLLLLYNIYSHGIIWSVRANIFYI